MDERKKYIEKMVAEVSDVMKSIKIEENMPLSQLKEKTKEQLDNLDRILNKNKDEMIRLGISSKDIIDKLIHEDTNYVPSNCKKEVYENCVILNTEYVVPNILGSKEKFNEPKELITFCRDVLFEGYRREVKTSLSLCKGDSDRRVNVLNRGHQNAWLIAPKDNTITVTKLSLFLTGDDFKDAHSSYLKELKKSKNGNMALCQALPFADKNKVAFLISSKDLFAGVFYDLSEDLDISANPNKNEIFNDPTKLEEYLIQMNEKPTKDTSSNVYSRLFSIN